MQSSVIARSAASTRCTLRVCATLTVKPAFDPVGTSSRVHWPQTSQADARVFTLRHGLQERVKRVTPGTELLIVKEFNNPDDAKACAVCTTGGVKLGYVPKDLSQHFQAGVYTAVVDAVGWESSHTLLDMGVRVKSFKPLLSSSFGLIYSNMD